MHMFQDSNITPINSSGCSRPSIIGKVLVKPGSMAHLSVGLYEASIPEPKLSLEFHPEVSEVIGTSLNRIDDQGDYRLIYHFQNFGDVPCRITVRTCGGQG